MTAEYKDLKDKELIQIYQSGTEEEKDKVLKEFLERYERQIDKNWWVLCRQFDSSGYVLGIKNEYYSEALEAIYTAINKIDLSKIKDDNWKLVQYSNFYIRNVRTKMAKKIKQMAKERPLDNLSYIRGGDESKENKVDPEVEKAYNETIGNKENPESIVVEKEINRIRMEIMMAHYENWNDTYKIVFNSLKEGGTKRDAARKAGINDNMLARVLRHMKKELLVDFIKRGVA